MLLKEGDTGATVASLQRGLRMMCCDPNGLDGIFGPGCTAAVKKFQNKMGIEPADGICGDDTWNTLVSEIYEIQIILSAKGYDTGGNDGKAGPKTYEAVLQFQRDNGLTADGMVGDQTWAKLMAMGDGTGGTAGLPLKQGSRGSKVLCAQYALRILCCSPGTIDGTFGSRTYNAVKKFQSSNGLAADGIIGEATWEKLCTEIQNIQQALKNKGYAILVDGLAGLDTYEAVMQFQADNGLSKDGQVGAATREKLFGTAGGGVDGLPLKEGQSGEMITFLQRALRIAVINCPITGTFDAETKTCVIRYQGRNSLTADGIVGVKTWEKLRENVRRYQTALQNKGYDVGGIDGIAGDKTYNAILKFQSDNGLDADGMCGTQTQTKLFGASQGGGTTSSTLKLGSNGSLTRYLQIMLNKMGYPMSVDGIFGTTTENAVKDFQSKNALTADGIVGNGTWKKLFEKYKVPASGTGIVKFVNVAKHEVRVGFHEDNGNNINPYGQWYGNQGQAWCASFVSWCAYQAGILNTTVPKYHYTPTGAAWYRNRGKYHKRSTGYRAKSGDVVFFFDPSKGRIGHTGIVVRSTNDFIYTIEGNASDGVLERYYSRTDSYIDGYGENGGSAVEPPNPPISEGSSIQDVIGLIEQVESYCYSSQVKKDNEMVALETMNILRQEAYDGFQWEFTVPYGRDYISQQFPYKEEGLSKALEGYIGNGRKEISDGTAGRIDLAHLMATLITYYGDSDGVLSVPKQWAGWAGDLAQLWLTVSKDNTVQFNVLDSDAVYAEAKKTICKPELTGQKEGKFNYSDFCCDADAITLARMLRSKKQSGTLTRFPISSLLSEFYSKARTDKARAHEFLNEMGVNTTTPYEQIVNAIYNKFTGVKGIVCFKLIAEITFYEGYGKGLCRAFTDVLNAKK